MLTVILSNFILRDHGDDFDVRLATVPAIKTKWTTFVKQLTGTCLIPLNDVQCDDTEKPHYDMVVNSTVKGYFIIALSKESKEITVWDVKK